MANSSFSPQILLTVPRLQSGTHVQVLQRKWGPAPGHGDKSQSVNADHGDPTYLPSDWRAGKYNSSQLTNEGWPLGKDSEQ